MIRLSKKEKALMDMLRNFEEQYNLACEHCVRHCNIVRYQSMQ